MKIKLSIKDKDHNIKTGKNDYDDFNRLLEVEGEGHVYLADQNFYFEEGDYIHIILDKANQYLKIKFDESFDDTLVYVKKSEIIYKVPISKNWEEALPEYAFKGKRHYISVRYAEEAEINVYQNLALNTHDLNENIDVYPHASANVETRNDATFFARNVIDGIFANLSHGSYPYQSWGINRQDDAELKIDFGRKVSINQLRFTLRNDFPHDNYWTTGEVLFSDGSIEVFEFEKVPYPQVFIIEERKIEWLVFRNLIKSPEESPFPALTELEVYGKNV
ncbi:hypothetical protein [Globicatella sp. PHS-GS-PNBC-21-1553]|uniref:hypothetical protein n=1 Tax=Globicatella sp. PHS-GS-PNBC-21-1553 TaxID=2885764 RepID=UPI00298F2070|nr:hypothetical protein [Globicatella sp. PHS-GS-PNBC-21-1553]WPC08951.1 hypothetical protein LB888_01515 [Globicatella sp. PHS-GS-PNBC-21-1553]